jgi:hypothetical protein
MTSWLLAAVAILTLTALSFFVFPGHTILQSDTQIYIPILEHIGDPSLLARDEMAIRPHISFTLYDESALLLRSITGLSFEHVLQTQQFVYRGVFIFGVYLLATAAGAPPVLAWLVASLVSLGAAIIGPAVLTVEYEPVPRGFALPFVVFSFAMLARNRWTWSAFAATIAFAFHPPTALAYCGLLFGILLWRREYQAIGVLAIGPVLMLLTIFAQQPSPDKLPLFGRLDPSLESLQRVRAAYNWVSIWAGRWMYLYCLLSAVAVVAWMRVRSQLTRETNIIVVGLVFIGLISVPASYLFLEGLKLTLISQFQPGRYLLYVTFFAILLSCLAAVRAATLNRYWESALFLFVPLALAAMAWDPAKLLGPRIAVAGALAVICTIALKLSRHPRAAVAIPVAVIAAVAPFVALPLAGVTNYADLHTEELNALADWAARATTRDAIFQFTDIERRLEPGVFRARARRALYTDWKSGGQVNFLREFAFLWRDRWSAVSKQQPLDVYRQLGIDYVVFRSSNRQPGHTPVYQNSEWVVYDVRNSSTSRRSGIEAWAPARVTESAAAAFAKRSAASIGISSVRAAARAALNVSPAAVVSFAVTLKPGE